MTESVQAAVEGTAYSFDALFTYLVPDSLSGRISAGMRVVVPFGRGNRSRVALVFEVSPAPEDRSKLKYISALADSEPVISPEMIKLCRWIRDNTFCTYFDAFRAILPPGLSYTLQSRYEPVNGFSGSLTKPEEELLGKISGLRERYSAESAEKPVLRSLIDKGAVRESELLKRRVGDETTLMVKLAEQPEDAEPPKLTPKQKQVIEFLEENTAASVHEVCYALNITAAVVKRLVEKGILEEYEYQVFRLESSGGATESPSDIVFSPKQQEVYDGLLALMNEDAPKCALLRGITGSGKTSVFIRLINEAVKQGKSAIMLVPEISLTPQMVGKFRRLFGDEVAILHSSLSLGERADEYTRIKTGKAHIVVGTRSAVFAPVQNLGIIVIDEEGEGTYKSESAPRYHARDVAKQRCFWHGAFLLLASATPSLESYYNAKTGRYSLFELDERYNNAVLPEVFIVDMRIEQQNGNHSAFSMPLIEEMRTNLERGEQSILLLNRRGYHTSVRCATCGKAAECPNCALPLTYHKANNTVTCHYCGFTRALARVCPFCGSKFMVMKGTGTQRIEDEISEIFPKARILRMDADTTAAKNAFESKFKAFAAGEYDIIVGTQMIAKGLDFPNVTLVGVLKTDNSLYAGDFRAYERTFSLITQVVGRGGRGVKRGRAMIQTFTPDHYVLNLAASQNYPDFYKEEIELREAMLYPPFCDIIVVGFISLVDRDCSAAALRFRTILEEKHAECPEMPLRILGPARNVISKVNGRFRWRLILKCRNSSQLRKLVEQSLKQAGTEKQFRDVTFFADMNGDP